MAVARVAASLYLNSAPLVWAFTQGSQRGAVSLIGHEAPARCSDLLSRGEVDAALIPVFEYQQIDGISIVPDVCIGARERVRSVLLVSKRRLEEIETVALDSSSRTSAALLRVMLERFHCRRPRYETAEPDIAAMLEKNDAALLIGDPAITSAHHGLEVHDLAEMWKRQTGLPFVFAIWGVRDSRMVPGEVDFAAARDEGLASIEPIATSYSSRLGLDASDLVDYLSRSINYHLDDESLAGLDLYFEMCREAGLISQKKSLRYWS